MISDKDDASKDNTLQDESDIILTHRSGGSHTYVMHIRSQVNDVRRHPGVPDYQRPKGTGSYPKINHLQDQILNHISSLETLIKHHNEKAGTLITPIRLTFGEEGDNSKGKDKRKDPVEEADEDLKKPYKEVLKSPFTRGMGDAGVVLNVPANIRRAGEGMFDRMPNGCINSWTDLHEKFVERANETLSNFKERWTKEMGYIQGVPEVMQISAFMSNSKCPELARRLTDQVPQTVIEMMKRVDDFVKSEEAYKSTKFPRGEHPEKGQGTPYKGPWPPRIMQGGSLPKVDGYNTYNRRDHYQSYVSPRQQGQRKYWLLNSSSSYLPSSNDRNTEEGEFGQLEAALESGKLNHLVKDVRQRGGNRGKQTKNGSANGKIINMVYEKSDSRKRDVLALLLQHVCLTIQVHLMQTHTELVGFSGEQLLPIGKIELEVMFRSEGLSRRTMMKFTVVQWSSPYNIILERTWMKELWAISFTTHAMMKFPTPRGIATLVPRRDAIFECKQLEDKQILREQPKEETVENKGSPTEEDFMINPASPNQKVTIGTQGRVRLAADGYGQIPKTVKSALSKCKPKYNSRSTKVKGPRSREECGCYERS
ncbi:hypothetical protein Tco_1485114 [Tanacetum coccineum]